MEINTTNRGGNTAASQYNALDFMIRNTIRGMVNTMLPVMVTAVYAGGAGESTGQVDVQPLLSQRDGGGDKLDMAPLYKLPYSRIQGGKAALVIDPEVGDIGIAIFAQADSKGITEDTSSPILPATYAPYPLHAGWYIGGFLNKAPTVYIELNQDNTIAIQATGGVTITAPSVTVTGDVIAGGVSLMNHTHPGDSGGTTGSPN